MASDTPANISSLAGPFNPTDHYKTLVGKNHHSLTSNTALVYAAGGLPKPWPYVLIVVTASFIFAVFGTISAWKLPSPKKPSRWRVLRKPVIQYQVFRIVMMVVKCARISSSHKIPSSISTVSIAFSLIGNFLDWDDQFDGHSWAALICTVVLVFLLPAQLVPNYQLLNENEGGVPGAAGYGTLSLFGGTCLRPRDKGEDCSALGDLACASGPITGLVSNQGAYGEWLALVVGLMSIPVFLYYMLDHTYRHVISAKGRAGKGAIIPLTSLSAGDDASMAETPEPADKGALRAAIKYCVVIMFLILFIAVGLLALSSGLDYVDVMKAADGTRIWDCFTGNAPLVSGVAIKLWFKQQWNHSPLVEKFSFLALV